VIFLTGVQSTACDNLVLEDFLQRPVQVCASEYIHLPSLWSSYVIGQTIYIFMLWFVLLLSSSSSFPRLISAVGDWMSTILLHMAWP